MIKKSLLILSLILITSLTVKAQEYYIGARAGYQKAPSTSVGKFIIGAEFRAKFINYFGLEGSINFREEQYYKNSIIVSTVPIMISGMIYPFNQLSTGIIPINHIYGEIGFGVYPAAFKYSSYFRSLGFQDNSKQKFAWHFGGGIEIPISSSNNSANTIINLDVRYAYLNYGLTQLPYNINMKSNYIMYTAGLLLRI